MELKTPRRPLSPPRPVSIPHRYRTKIRPLSQVTWNKFTVIEETSSLAIAELTQCALHHFGCPTGKEEVPGFSG